MAERIRKAASVIAAREGRQGPEVLVLERSGTSRFLPGYVAFPGGATDAQDGRLAERWFGASEEAPRACAVRELLEEVGLALTASGLRSAPHGVLDVVAEDPPRAEQLPQIAHWVAPEDVPVRFDARYFAVAAGPDAEPEADGTEIARAWWVAPRALLEDWELGRKKLYWPTYFTLEQLASCGSVGELLALRLETREPDPADVERLPRSTFWED
ncbi:MAG TPA: NUDIX domain-containing protein [Actinomycetota bacterium]